MDPSGTLLVLKESIVGHCDDVEKAVGKAAWLKLGDMDRILCSELAEGGSNANESLSNEEDVTVLGVLPSKCVLFSFANESTIHKLTGRGF